MGSVWRDYFVIILKFWNLFEGLQLPGDFFDSKLWFCWANWILSIVAASLTLQPLQASAWVRLVRMKLKELGLALSPLPSECQKPVPWLLIENSDHRIEDKEISNLLLGCVCVCLPIVTRPPLLQLMCIPGNLGRLSFIPFVRKKLRGGEPDTKNRVFNKHRREIRKSLPVGTELCRHRKELPQGSSWHGASP